MKKIRTRRVNIGIEVLFDGFYEELERNLKNALTNAISNTICIDNIDRASDVLRHELFGMHIVGAFNWKEYVILREKVERIAREHIATIKSL